MSYDVFWHMEYLCEALIYSIHFSYIFFIWKVRPFERRLFTIQTFVSPRCLVSNDWWIKKSSNVRIAHCLSSQSPYTNSSVWWWISDMFILFVLLYWRHYQTFLVYLIFNISFQTLSHSHDVNNSPCKKNTAFTALRSSLSAPFFNIDVILCAQMFDLQPFMVIITNSSHVSGSSHRPLVSLLPRSVWT